MAKNFKKTKDFLKNPFYILINLLLSILGVWGVHYTRITLKLSYKLSNSISLAILLLTIVNVYMAMKDPDNNTKSMLLKCLPAAISFVAFIFAKLYLRG